MLQRAPGAAGVGGGKLFAVGGGDGCVGGVGSENRDQVLGSGGVDSLPMLAVDGAQDGAGAAYDPACGGGWRCGRSQSGTDPAALLLPEAVGLTMLNRSVGAEPPAFDIVGSAHGDHSRRGAQARGRAETSDCGGSGRGLNNSVRAGEGCACRAA